MSIIKFNYFFMISIACFLNIWNSAEKIKIQHTFKQIIAERIFGLYGIRYFQSRYLANKMDMFARLLPFLNLVNHVCKSIDGKSNRVYGEAACRTASTKLYGFSAEINGRVSCEDINITAKTFDDNGNIIKEVPVMVKMAKCPYKRAGTEDTFYIANGPQYDHFYIITYPSGETDTPSITACLHLIPRTDLVPRPIISETNDPAEADDIFGVYGQNIPNSVFPVKIQNHICRNMSRNPNALPEEKYCSYVLKRESVNKSLALRRPVHCVKARVIRQIVNINAVIYLMSEPMYMIKCTYQKGSFMLLNGPTDNLFYIAKNAINFSRDPLVVYIRSVYKIDF